MLGNKSPSQLFLLRHRSELLYIHVLQQLVVNRHVSGFLWDHQTLHSMLFPDQQKFHWGPSKMQKNKLHLIFAFDCELLRVLLVLKTIWLEMRPKLLGLHSQMLLYNDFNQHLIWPYLIWTPYYMDHKLWVIIFTFISTSGVCFQITKYFALIFGTCIFVVFVKIPMNWKKSFFLKTFFFHECISDRMNKTRSRSILDDIL